MNIYCANGFTAARVVRKAIPADARPPDVTGFTVSREQALEFEVERGR